MDDIPPAEAFEPQPDEPVGESRLRRQILVVVTIVLIAAMVVLAAVEGGGFIVQGDANVPAPATGRIAVVDSAGALTWVDDRGGPVVGYSVPDVTFQFPAWSPDGQQIAAVGTGVQGAGVYIFGAQASTDAPGAPTVIYESADRPPFYLYWTPDGQHVTFLTTEPDGLALRIAPADGSLEASTVRAGAPMYWDFVDPGRLLIHSGTIGTDSFFAEVGVDGAPFDATNAAPGVFRSPSVSIDDRYRAYAAGGGGDAFGEVVLEGRDGSGTKRIPVFGPAALAFNPEGDELAFIALEEPVGGNILLPVGPLRLIAPGAEEVRTLLGSRVVAFFWSPTGTDIAALMLEDPDDTVTEARTIGFGEAASGVALRLAFVEVATGLIRSEREVRLSDLFVNQVLPFFDQYALSHRFWSPDGASLLLPLVDQADVIQVAVIPADGSDARAVATGAMGFWSP